MISESQLGPQIDSFNSNLIEMETHLNLIVESN